MVGVNITAADTDEEAFFLETTLQQQFLNLIRNNDVPLQPPVENMDALWGAYEKEALKQQLGSSIAGSSETVREKLQEFLDDTHR